MDGKVYIEFRRIVYLDKNSFFVCVWNDMFTNMAMH